MKAINSSWLDGEFANGEINTRMPFIAVNDPEYFAQGSDADRIIDEICNYYNKFDVTEEQAFNWWVNTFLI